MSTRTFTLTLDDGDRLMVLTALGFASMHLMAGNVDVKMRRPIDELISRLIGANGWDGATTPQTPREILSDAHVRRDHARDDDPKSGSEAARAVLAPAPVTTHDYFAADRKGNIPLKPPTGATLQTVDILTTAESPDRKHLKVVFKGEGKASKANCFDRELWPHIVRRTGASAQMWIVESGNYLNIVGVRA
jgi:hypothetical protein